MKERLHAISFASVFLISLVASMLFMVWNQRELLLQSEGLSEGALSLVKMRESSNGSLFFYVLRERMWVVPALFLFSTTYLATIAVYGSIVWYGLSLGSLLAMALLRYGITGMFFLVICGMPQYLFYVPAFIIALRVSVDVRRPDKKFFLQLIVLESIILVGCLVESYVNSLFVDKIIKFFIGV